MLRALGLLALGLTMLAGTARADLIGRSVTPSYQYPALGTVYPAAAWSAGSFVVGTGEEATALIEGVTTLHVDLSADALAIRFATSLGNPTWNAVAFNGPVFTFAGAPLGIAGATVVAAGTTLAGFDDGRVSVTASEIRVNWSGLSYGDGTMLRIAFTFGAAPPPSVPAIEPASIAVFGAGLLGLAALGRRRRHP